MGVDAVLYAASQDQSLRAADTHTVVNKPTSVHATSVTGDTVIQNGSRQEGVYAVNKFVHKFAKLCIFLL